ncbi:MAG TPA: sensor histidine kinase [Oculatellaceae cyanobacterium]
MVDSTKIQPTEPNALFGHGTLLGKLQNLEVALIMLTGLLEAMVTPLAAHSTLSSSLVASIVCLGVLAVISQYPPVNQSFPYRFGYLLLELCIVFAASIFGAYRVFSLLFATVIAKAALLLPFRGLIALMFITAALHLTGSQLNPIISHEEATKPSSSLISLLEYRFESEAFMLSLLVLVGLMSRTVVSERESKRQVEELAMEVETLATFQERARIAREIHDALGHTLTSLNIQLEVAKKMQDRDPEKSRAALYSAKELASQSLNDVRQALHMIVPSREDSDPFDINEAIPQLVRQVEQNQPVKIRLDLERVKLSANKSHHLYCIVRECLTNIQRHASATQIGIAFSQPADIILVEISDDGRGFDPQEAGGGFGLSGMKERVEFLGGSLAIQSSPGVGTKIKVSVPS